MNLIQNKGFSTLELLFALLIISIIFFFAYPSYQQSIYKARRHDAFSTLEQLQLIFEQCYAKHHSYDISCSQLPSTPYNSSHNYYNINYYQQEDNAYILTATPKDEQINDTTCAQISINQAHIKTAVDVNGISNSICWHM